MILELFNIFWNKKQKKHWLIAWRLNRDKKMIDGFYLVYANLIQIIVYSIFIVYERLFGLGYDVLNLIYKFSFS